MIYFICAGKGSRMKSEIPKALHLVNGVPNVVRNSRMVDDFRVVINSSDKEMFLKHFSDEDLVTIESGLGSGHAIMQLTLLPGDIIIWGDAVILDSSVIKELELVDDISKMIVPLKKVTNPYVNFYVDEKFNIQEVLFSKYGETSPFGYQDCCIFKASIGFTNYLKGLHNGIWKSRYITESSEFEFLYIAHYLYNIGNPAKGYLTEYPDAILSYNTKEELAEITKRLKN